MNSSYDCIVMGGGPAGSTTAALLAEAGVQTLLVEREKFPRFHIGESLMPETYWTLERLGVLDRMRSSSFVKKESVQFVNPSGRQSVPFFFKEHDPRECSQTWQVERAKFDQMLFDNAAEKGAECHDETRVLEVLFEGDRATGVKLQTSDDISHKIAAQVVVDATGGHTLIASTLGIRHVNPTLRKASVWSYFRGATRDPGPNGGATVIFHTQSRNAWFWSIPLSDNITSVGVVGDNDYLLKGRGTPEKIFQEELADCPALAQRLDGAEQTDKVRVVKEFSYSTERAAGDGWVLVGDAWGFIDPIYSSGVFFALKSGELAADCIVEALRKGDTSGAQLGRWADAFVAGTQWVGRLVAAFYTPEFSFGRFLKEHPNHRGALTDLLIGRIFHADAGRIFDDMLPVAGRNKASS